jgi:hypothetical protein
MAWIVRLFFYYFYCFFVVFFSTTFHHTIVLVPHQEHLSGLFSNFKFIRNLILFPNTFYYRHFPWFLTFNFLNKYMPTYDDMLPTLLRNGSIGFTASVVSDVSSNSLRVIKTTKQTFSEPITYVPTNCFTKCVCLCTERDTTLTIF